ncbi:MAG: magnesium transporter [Verrucomicrobiales bacterium]|jgi:magnesium transporter
MPEAAARELQEALVDSLKQQDSEAVLTLLSPLSIDDQRRAVDRLSAGQREALLALLPSIDAAELVEHLAEAQAVEVLEDLPADKAASILHELSEELGGDLLREMDAEDSAAILAEVEDAEEQLHLQERLAYAWDTAGGLMNSDIFSFHRGHTIRDVVHGLSEIAETEDEPDIQYVYVTDETDKLIGVLRLRDLVLRKSTLPIEEVMIPDPFNVSVHRSLEELDDIFEAKPYLGLPVVDEAGTLRGVISREDVQEALAERQKDSYLKSRGIVSGEELRSMPLRERCVRRFSWLAPNIVLNLIAASVIAAYEDTLQAVVALAIFLPVVSDMSGCSGNQAVAVSIRELTLGVLKPRDYMRVILKEGLLGFFNGVTLGIVLGIIVFLMKGNLYLSLVIGGALALNTIVSVLIGGLVPLVMKRFKVDPALASGPILTTCTDMFGFFLVLSLASMMLSRLT